jgi:hypothetical protein
MAHIHQEKNLLIPLRDGASLAADLHLPAGKGPFPAIISYYPYHKDDFIGSTFEYPRRYFAEQGYAHLLVDFRGLGNSDGVAWEAGDQGENEDGAAIVEWAASQPWCDGNLGMWGISYGGITTLQTASERPPHLKAIVPVFALSNVYHDYLFPGGCPSCMGSFGAWGSFMTAMNLMPPGYQDPQGRWYRVWKEHLEKNQPHILPWMGRPAYDEYWQSKVIPVENITVPTMVIGGWRDVFPEAMVNLYERLSAPKKLVMGPWTHVAPDMAPFEPWDYLHGMKRWWDCWLKGENNGLLDEPPVTLFVQGINRWKHEQEWPIARTKKSTFFLLNSGVLADRASQKTSSDPYQAVPTVGAMGGLWDVVSIGLLTPQDQGPEDLQSLTYTSDPLPEDMEISGSPEAILYVALESGDEVNLVARLTAVGPKGGSSLITRGWLRGTHHSSHERPESLEMGKVYEFHIPLWATSYLVPKGHRLRLSVSCSDFPRLWPTPTNPQIRLFSGGSSASFVKLPVVPPAPTPITGPEMLRPDPAVNRAPLLTEFAPRWIIEQDLATGTLTVVTGMKQQLIIASGGKLSIDYTVEASVTNSQPDGAKIKGEATMHLDLPVTGPVQVETKTLISQNRMLVTGKVTVDGQLFFEKQWLK